MTGADDKALEKEALLKLGPPYTLPSHLRISRDDIMVLRKMGYSMERIGEYFDVSRRTVYNVLGKMDFNERWDESRVRHRRYLKLVDEEGVNIK
jgi:hypothetical protein